MPFIEIMLRADNHYCTPKVLRFCRAERLDYTLGVDQHVAKTHHYAGAEHHRARGRGMWREAAPLQGILRWRRKLGPRRAYHRAR